MILTHKIRIYPNKTLIKQFEGYFGYTRYVYNKSLNIWNEMYKDDLKPNERKVRDEYKRNRKELWEKEYSPIVLDNSISYMSRAWSSYFSKIGQRPRFKSKKRSKDSFTFNRKNDSTIRIKRDRLFLPKMKYGIKLSELPKFNGIIKTATVTRKFNQYFVSLSIELDKNNHIYHSNSNNPTVGIDVNIGHFDTSDNEVFNTPLKELGYLYKRIDHLNRKLSRKIPGSNKYNLVKTKLGRTYLKINNIQTDWLNKFTTYIVTNYHRIGIETLNVKGMLMNKRLSKSIARSLFYKFRLLLTYKSEIYGNSLVLADSHFPSTQLCSDCGNRKTGSDKLNLSDREYKCYECGIIKDRDYNSACNLKILADEVG